MDLKTAHTFSSNHRAQVQASERCGCFYCLEIFDPAKIVEWVDDDTTALCPLCGIDSIIGSNSYPEFDKALLLAMHAYWF